MPASVPRNSQAKFFTPPAMPVIADRAHDVIGGQHRENVEPAPGDGAHLLGPHGDEALQQLRGGAEGAGARRWPDHGGRTGRAPRRSSELRGDLADLVRRVLAAERGPRRQIFPIGSPPTSTGSKPISLISTVASTIALCRLRPSVCPAARRDGSRPSRAPRS